MRRDVQEEEKSQEKKNFCNYAWRWMLTRQCGDNLTIYTNIDHYVI